MEKLTEGQFQTVWKIAVGEKGYDKKLFQYLLGKLKRKNLITEQASVCVCGKSTASESSENSDESTSLDS